MTGPVTVSYRGEETPQGTTIQKYLDAGQNPPDGVIIHYTLPENVSGKVTLRILDDAGTEVRAFSGKANQTVTMTAEAPTSGEAPGGGTAEAPESPAIEEDTDDEQALGGQVVPVAAGANRFVWDLRYAAPTALVDAGGKRTARLQAMDDGIPPKAAPGTYTVELKVGGETLTQEFTLLKDPRVPASEEELRSQFELKLAIRDRVSAINEGLNQLRRMRAQIEIAAGRGKEADYAEMAEAAKALTATLNEIEENLTLVKSDRPRPGPIKIKEKFAGLAGMIDESDDAPTMNAHAVYTLLSEQTEEELTKLMHFASEDIVSFNNLEKKADLAAVKK
jgi:hypothetical protein